MPIPSTERNRKSVEIYSTGTFLCVELRVLRLSQTELWVCSDFDECQYSVSFDRELWCLRSGSCMLSGLCGFRH